MRLVGFTALALLAAPTAISAPQFPLSFKGFACDHVNGNCHDLFMVLDADGRLLERFTGAEGRYLWQDQMLMLEIPDAGLTAMLHRTDPNTACVRGEWWMMNGHTGEIELCRA